MSLSITIDVNGATAQAAVSAVAEALKDRQGMHGTISKSVLGIVRKHLDDKYVPRNSRGDFWADVRNSAQSSATADEATVSLTELGIALRYHGGEVTPGKSISSFTGKLTRALAVPSAEVPIRDGRQIRPGRAGVLAFIESKTAGETVGYLVEGVLKTAVRGKNKGQPYAVAKPGGALLYTLRTITRHRGDKGIFPTESAISDAGSAAILDFVKSFE
jgi:hypothetical protein